MSAEERAADISLRIRRNLGVFAVPAYNHVGDPHDKWGDLASSNRMMLAPRDGISFAQPTEMWKQVIHHEQRGAAAKGGASPFPPPPPLATGAASEPPPASAAKPAAGSHMPPGWYYVPTLGGDGELKNALTYVPYAFAMPPS